MPSGVWLTPAGKVFLNNDGHAMIGDDPIACCACVADIACACCLSNVAPAQWLLISTTTNGLCTDFCNLFDSIVLNAAGPGSCTWNSGIWTVCVSGSPATTSITLSISCYPFTPLGTVNFHVQFHNIQCFFDLTTNPGDTNCNSPRTIPIQTDAGTYCTCPQSVYIFPMRD